MVLKTVIARPLQLLFNNIFMLSVTIVLYFGWLQRGENYFTAENGIGYFLGLVGGSLMLVLLLYPISKRVKLFTKWIPIRYWFGLHMALGVIGPVMIMFHSNFKFGSMNSTVAMICMLLVAGSGLIGRYIYTHIHNGLYGSRVTINELQQKSENNHTELINLFGNGEHLNSDLKKMEEKVLRPYSGFMTSLFHVIYLGFNTYGMKMKVMRLVIKTDGNDSDGNGNKVDKKKIYSSVSRYTLALRKLAAHRVYERLFSLWHILHLPLFFMMIITSVIHVYAVHVY